MNYYFEDPTAADFDQMPINAKEVKQIYRGCIITTIIILILVGGIIAIIITD